MLKHPTLIAVALTFGAISLQPANAQRFRGSNLRDNRSVHAELRKPVSVAAKSTVRVLLDDKAVALGCVVSESGEILTKASLLDGEGELKIRRTDGSVVDAIRLATDEKYDLGLIKAASGKFVAMEFHTDSKPQVGTIVGVPSEAGTVLGAGIISMETGQPRLRDSKRRVRMGVNVAPAEGGGLTINEVVRDSAAARARVQKGDRLISIDGLKVNALNDLLAVLSKHKYGDRVRFRLDRDGNSKQGSILFRSPYDRWGGGEFSQRRFSFPKVVFHDVTIEPEECGGPLVDLNGRVVGLNISRALRVASYAIPATEIDRLRRNLVAKATSASTPKQAARPLTGSGVYVMAMLSE